MCRVFFFVGLMLSGVMSGELLWIMFLFYVEYCIKLNLIEDT